MAVEILPARQHHEPPPPRVPNNFLPPFWSTALQTRPAPPGKRLSPGLELRLQKLEEHRRRKEDARRQLSIGRIPAEQILELEQLQRQRQVVEIRRRGRTWTGPHPPPPLLLLRAMPAGGGVRLSGGLVWTDTEAASSVLESDVSSVMDISDCLVASDTEDDQLHDSDKYRMPETGKTRLHLRTKEPLSPNPRRVVGEETASLRGESRNSTPSTPRSGNPAANGNSSPRMEFPANWGNGNADHGPSNDFAGMSLSRAGSIYTLGRASFAGQLAQLTSMRLPDANSLAKRISSIPTSTEAAKTLSDASDQIRMWIAKASDVLNGLDAEDDVEWAAAGGREGISDVDDAISRFERLVQVYILSIERLHTRPDVSLLSAGELNDVVKQMESIMTSWKKIKDKLRGIKQQVEIAMEWEELWNTVLGEIAQEMDGLNRLVFEMEEKRHQSAEGLLSSRDSIDISELETIVERHPGRGRMRQSSRFGVQHQFSPSSPIQPVEPVEDKDDGSLLGLFARMQPLRASLDFLPMRLSAFHIRGNPTFPTACLDLENRRDQLEELWMKLGADAESLRRELGEDRWVLVFRNAGRQALKMCESITRTFAKLKEGIDAGEQQTNMLTLTKKIENYEAKKTHYGPAIERVLAIIDRGVMVRLTVNGEILRLQSDMKRRWTSLQAEMRDLDAIVEDINSSESREKQLRDSVSTVMSSERSVISSLVDTPGSSPASSVMASSSRKNSFQGCRTPTPLTTFRIRDTSRSRSRVPSGSSSIPRHRLPLTRTAAPENHPSPTSSSATPSKTSPAWPSRPEVAPSNRPRWTGRLQPEKRDFLPLSTLEPSPYAKPPVTPKTNFLRSTARASLAPTTPSAPLSRASSRMVSTPNPPTTLPRPTPGSTTRKSSLPVPASLATPARKSGGLNSKAPQSSARPASRLAGTRRSSVLLSAPALTADGNEADNESPAHHRRPPSAMASGRGSSMLPQRAGSRMGEAAAAGQKPKWR